MTGSGPAVVNPGLLTQQLESEVVETRFGKVTINPAHPILFPNGLLGMPDKIKFCISALPTEKMARFKLMQSLDDKNLSFIVLPVDINNSIAEKADMETAARDLGIAPADMAVMFVVSVHRESSGVKLSVNARAPIIINSAKRLATQYVFHNAKYQIRHALTL